MIKENLKKIICISFTTMAIAALFALCGCSINKDANKIEVTDYLGKTFKFDQPIQKIVSTHNPTLNHVVVLGNGTSKYLAGFGNKDKANNLYKQILPDWDNLTVIGDSSNPVNKETIISLHPDLALVPENLSAMKDKDYEGTGVDTFVSSPAKESFASITDSLKLIAKLFGEEERANTITDQFNQICTDVKQSLKNVNQSDKQKVLFMGSKLYNVATSDMIQTQSIEEAGGINCAKDEFESGFFANTDVETIVKLNPDVILFPNYAKFSVEDILNDSKLQTVNAIKNKKVYKFPCSLEPWDYPTCSACLGLAWTAHILHPELYTKEKLNKTCEDFYSLLYNKNFTAQQLGIDN